MAHFYYNTLKQLEKDQKELLSYLTKDERQRPYFGQLARGKLRKLLSQDLECGPKDISFKYEKFGKPYITNALCFNISHSNESLIIGVSHDFNIGVDIEVIKPRKTRDRLAKKIMSSNELNLYENSSDKDLFFYRTWTAKEAISKYYGFGITKDFSKIELERHSDQLIKYKDLFINHCIKNNIIAAQAGPQDHSRLFKDLL